MKKNYISAGICFILVVVITFFSANIFLSYRVNDTLIPGEGVSEVKMLSDYFPPIKGTNADTAIYIMRGSKPGGSMLVLGGTHANEPSGYLAAVTFIESGKIDAGTVYVIPRAANSGFTHNDPQEGAPDYVKINTPSGERTFRFGSRAANPLDQWPDPEIYIHAASGQTLSGSETRNLNRAYPGKSDGTLTEQNAFAIVELIKTEKIDLTFDLHEASPEYPVINATVAHEKAMGIASMGVFELEMKGIKMGLEPSPQNLRGLTHRELGDYTDTLPILMETANASQGRLRGKTSAYQALTGKDEDYVKAAKLGFLYVPYDENGHPIEERVGRHLEGIYEYSKALSEQNPEKAIVYSGVPSYDELFGSAEKEKLGGDKLGSYLN